MEQEAARETEPSGSYGV